MPRVFVYSDNKLVELKDNYKCDIYQDKVIRVFKIINNTPHNIVDTMLIIYNNGKKELMNGYIPIDIINSISETHISDDSVN